MRRSVPVVSNSTPIADLGLSTRLVGALSAEGLTTIGAVTELSREDLRRTPGLGPKAVDALVGILKAHGLKLRDEVRADAELELVRARIAIVLSKYLATPLAQIASKEIIDAMRQFLSLE